MELLIEEYSDQVKEIINTCHIHSRSAIDISFLNTEIQSLRIEPQSFFSLSEDEWYEIIFELAPDVYDDLYYGSFAA